MDKINKDMVLVFLVIILAVWVIYPFIEGFDATTTEFVPVGAPRYGLRGELLRRSPISKYFIRPDRQIRLSQSGNLMWESNNAPGDEGVGGCRKVPCPGYYGGYDGTDTCWECGSRCPPKTVIPDIHPHVKN